MPDLRLRDQNDAQGVYFKFAMLASHVGVQRPGHGNEPTTTTVPQVPVGRAPGANFVHVKEADGPRRGGDGKQALLCWRKAVHLGRREAERRGYDGTDDWNAAEAGRQQAHRGDGPRPVSTWMC